MSDAADAMAYALGGLDLRRRPRSGKVDLPYGLWRWQGARFPARSPRGGLDKGTDLSLSYGGFPYVGPSAGGGRWALEGAPVARALHRYTGWCALKAATEILGTAQHKIRDLIARCVWVPDVELRAEVLRWGSEQITKHREATPDDRSPLQVGIAAINYATNHNLRPRVRAMLASQMAMRQQLNQEGNDARTLFDMMLARRLFAEVQLQRFVPQDMRHLMGGDVADRAVLEDFARSRGLDHLAESLGYDREHPHLVPCE